MDVRYFRVKPLKKICPVSLNAELYIKKYFLHDNFFRFFNKRPVALTLKLLFLNKRAPRVLNR